MICHEVQKVKLHNWVIQKGLLEEKDFLSFRAYRIGLIDAFIHLQTDNIRTANIHFRSFNRKSWQTRTSRNEHGNLMASLICGQSDTPFEGLMPEASVFISNAIKNRDPRCNAAAISQAIQWMCDESVDVILLPFGLKQAFRQISHALSLAQASGVQIVAGAGNHGQDNLYYPACHPAVIAVTASDETGQTLTGFCDIRRADAHILATQVPCYSDSGQTFIQGTSPACVLWALRSLVKSINQVTSFSLS